MSTGDRNNGRHHAADDAGDPLEGELLKLGREPGTEPSLDTEALFAGLSQRLAHERGIAAWLRSRSTPLRALLAAAMLAGLLALAIVTSLRRDIAVYPGPRMALVLAALGASLLSLVFVLLRPLQWPALPARAAPALALAAIAGALVISVLPEAHHAHSSSMVYGQSISSHLVRAVPCVVIGLMNGLVAYGLLVALDRGGRRRVALPGIAAGLVAYMVLQLVCPVTGPTHLVLAHFGVLLMLVGFARLHRAVS
jgi:hypothetical protein